MFNQKEKGKITFHFNTNNQKKMLFDSYEGCESNP